MGQKNKPAGNVSAENKTNMDAQAASVAAEQKAKADKEAADKAAADKAAADKAAKEAAKPKAKLSERELDIMDRMDVDKLWKNTRGEYFTSESYALHSEGGNKEKIKSIQR